MIAPPDWLMAVSEPWASLYSDSAVVRTAIVALHVVPLVLGGGVAVATDRTTLRAGRAGADDDARTRQLVELGHVHRWVGVALALTMLSGVFLLLSDLELYLGSWIYWSKMGLVLALLVNGVAMMRAERSLAVQREGGVWDEHALPQWRRLERSARTSLALWLLITVAGVALVNAA